MIDLVLYVFNSLGFEDFTASFVRDPNSPDKYIGKVEDWDKAEQAIINATQKKDSIMLSKKVKLHSMAQNWTSWQKTHWEGAGNWARFKLIIAYLSDLILPTKEMIINFTGQ